MPTAFTSPIRATELQEPGAGGRPPVDRRPTGGGGGGDDDKHPRRRGPREALHQVRSLVFTAILCDMLLFLALVSLFFARQNGVHLDMASHQQVHDWLPLTLPKILFLNTLLLLTSCMTMELARRHIFVEIDVLEEWLGLGKPALRQARPWLAATTVLGLLFLAGQWEAWKQLRLLGHSLNSSLDPSSYFFSLLTGVHALHLAIGLLGLLFCLTLVGFLRKVEFRQIAIDSTAWVWQAFSLIWLGLYSVLLFGQ
ncbi:heme-copper oxidase subunit III [Telmatobacter bradus]|uniref:heme-copper oxidase subunit III n=1 Tax=Telmatobacter bradus TaxID=474953 RepID=UPI003B435510